ncbi:MAG: MerR family transcriptional regulator, partial [Candidatus Nanopelagicales bacterium]
DGASVYACTSADEVIDLVRGGQGVFGIAVGRVWEEVEGTLATLPTEPTEPTVTAAATDELSMRRAQRHAG